jgi:cation transport regulator ChaB
MPYSQNSELPKSVREALPDHAQSIFRHVANTEIAGGKSDAVAFAAAWSTLSRQGWAKGKDGKWQKVKKELELQGNICKTDAGQNLVFGWASVIEKDGQPVVDLQGDVIRPAELEKSAYAFVHDVRVAGEMHKRIGVGSLVESVVLTKEKQAAMGIPEDANIPVGWWIGMKVDPEVFAKVKSGEYNAFSIGGLGKRKDITSGE